jgi:hypothetical protein
MSLAPAVLYFSDKSGNYLNKKNNRILSDLKPEWQHTFIGIKSFDIISLKTNIPQKKECGIKRNS